MTHEPEGTRIRCPECGSPDLAGDRVPPERDQVPMRHGYPGEPGHEIAYYEWVDFRCRDCGHQWRDEEERPAPISPLQRALWEEQPSRKPWEEPTIVLEEKYSLLGGFND